MNLILMWAWQHARTIRKVSTSRPLAGLCMVWVGCLLTCLLAPWPYAVVTIFFTAFLHLAYLEAREVLSESD